MEKINFKVFFFITIMYLLIFQDFLQKFVSPFKYFDEILSLLLFPILFLYCYKNRENLKISKKNLVILTSLTMIIILGLYSNYHYKYQPIKIVFSDLLLFLKFFLAYFLSSILWKEGFFEKNRKKILFHVKIIIIFLLILTLLNYLFNLFPAITYRFGIKANSLFYTHPTVLATVIIFLIALLIRCDKKTFSIYFIICILILASTLRFKAIGACLIVISLAYYIDKFNKKFSVSKLLLAATVVVILAFDQISYYYLDTDGSARKELTNQSFVIAKDYFPIGSGFGTYASYFSAVSYSPLYYYYNLYKIQGLTPNEPSFVSDVFWPMILGQFGYIGFCLYILCIFEIFKKIQDEFSTENKYIYISKLVCLAYLIISSTSEASFAGTLAIPLAIIIGSESTKKENNI